MHRPHAHYLTTHKWRLSLVLLFALEVAGSWAPLLGNTWLRKTIVISRSVIAHFFPVNYHIWSIAILHWQVFIYFLIRLYFLSVYFLFCLDTYLFLCSSWAWFSHRGRLFWWFSVQTTFWWIILSFCIAIYRFVFYLMLVISQWILLL